VVRGNVERPEGIKRKESERGAGVPGVGMILLPEGRKSGIRTVMGGP